MAVDESKLSRDLSRGRRVQQFLKSDDAKQSIRALETEYWKQWAATRPDEVAVREEIYRRLLAMRDMIQNLQSVAGAGKLAQRQIDEIEAKARSRAT